MMSLLSKRGKDRVMIDQLQTHSKAVDEGAETLISMIEDKLETIESKIIEFKSEKKRSLRQMLKKMLRTHILERR